MITRRNWLLRCSIIINIAVLVYICSQLIYRDDSLQLPSSSADYLIQQQQQQQLNGAGSPPVLLDQMGRKKLSLDSPNLVVIHSSSSSSSTNNLNSNIISANGIGASDVQQPVSGNK